MQKDNKTVQNSIARKIWIKLDTFKKIMMYARRLFKLAPIRSMHAVDINFTTCMHVLVALDIHNTIQRIHLCARGVLVHT